MDAPRLIFLYPSAAAGTVQRIEASQVPRERLTGFFQLKERGWDVTISDARWTGSLGRVRKKFRRLIELPNLATIRAIRAADAVVVKDDFSVTLTLLSKCLRRKIIYLDSMFRVPTRKLRRIATRMNLTMADGVITFSETQANLWATEFGLPASRFSNTHYCVDTQFYQLDEYTPDLESPYILAVGRDPGRDFETLIRALEQTPFRLKIVAPRYLLPAAARSHKQIEILENLSYKDLFSLYKSAAAVAIPLKTGVTYPSGIRAAMEALSLGVPTICSYTPVLEEYFENGKHLVLVEPQNPKALASALTRITEDDGLRSTLRQEGRKAMMQRYDVEIYADQLESSLAKILQMGSGIEHSKPRIAAGSEKTAKASLSSSA